MVGELNSPEDTQSAAQPQLTLETMQNAILGQESGNRSNVGTSVTGARGPGQIEPNTFAQYAIPGERIDNPDDNRRVNARILSDYMRRWPNDPARVAVAYFSGPGNVAPTGNPTPYIHDFQDPNGKSVSSYVNDIQHRISGTPVARGVGSLGGGIALPETGASQPPSALQSIGGAIFDTAQKQGKENPQAAQPAAHSAGPPIGNAIGSSPLGLQPQQVQPPQIPQDYYSALMGLPNG